MSLLFLLVSLAFADDVHVVRAGDTVESIAASRGDASLVDPIREANGLKAGEQPAPGTVLELPGVETIAQPGQVLSLSGQGTLTPPGGEPIPLVEGAFLIVGTEVCTAADSYASVRLASIADCADEDAVTMLPGTCLTLRASAARSQTRTSVVSVSSGAITVRDTEGASEVAVQTSAGTTTGGNGGFRVAVEDEATRTEAVTGQVAVLAGGEEKEVPAGFGVRTNDGEAPGDLVELLPPGTPIRPAAGAQLVVPDFEWTSVPRALGYRLELAEDPDMVGLVRRTEVGPPTWTPTQLFLPYDSPTLYWRIVPFDRVGFEGIPSQPMPVTFPSGVVAEQ